MSPRRFSIGRKRGGVNPVARAKSRAFEIGARLRRGVADRARLSTTVQPTQAGGEAIRKGVPPEILRQVKLIELRTRGLVNSVFTGEYRSVFKGQGMEFSEVREYQPGDEVRSIDWNVTARMRRPFVKRYIEERELTVMLVVDLSGSERFGTVKRFKSELASELAAVLAMSAVRNNDRVGVVLFTDRIEYVVPPRKGRKHVLRIMRDLLSFEPVGKGTDIVGVIDHLARTLKQKAIVFLISDFVAPRHRASAQDSRAASRRRRGDGRRSERARAARHRPRAVSSIRRPASTSRSTPARQSCAPISRGA